MEPELWRRVEVLFHRVVELDPTEHSAFLEESGCDPEVRSAVEALVRSDMGGDPVLDGVDAVQPPGGPDRMLGRLVGHYRPTRVIGAGGMGVVYAAERADGLFEQRVAVKLMRSVLDSSDALRRFDRERRVLAALSHANIARLYDAGLTDEGLPYLAMELVDGQPIDRWCDARRLSVAQRVALFVEVARAVQFAHTNLVVHMDLKPGNVLVAEDGSPKLLDFGIARLLDGGEQSRATTRTRAQLMTPEYASPEQLSGGPITTATDVYSLGVVLYVLLTGRRPYHSASQSPSEWERLVAEGAPPRPSTAVLRRTATSAPGEGLEHLDRAGLAARFGTTPRRLRRLLSGDLDRIVLTALRREPERRYPSAQALAEDLERHLEGRPIRAREDSVGHRLLRFAQRHRVAASSGSAVVLAVLGGALAAYRGERQTRVQAEHARIEAESFQGIASFLQEHLLEMRGASVAGDPEFIEAARAKIRSQAEQVRRQHAGQVHLRANMLDALGDLALRYDQPDLAAELIDEALALREAEFGKQSLEVALSLRSRGTLLCSAGDLPGAEAVLRHRLDLQRSLPPGTHTDLASASTDLAVVLCSLGQFEEAQRLHEEALALRRADSPESLPVAESLSDLADVALECGRPAEAVELLSKALGIRRAILGDDHALTLESRSDLADVCFRVGKEDETRREFGEVELGLRRLGVAGEGALAGVLSKLAALDLRDDDLGPAEARLDEALSIQRRRLHAGHPGVTSLLERLARLREKQGDLARAERDWRGVLEARRESLPHSHPEIGRTLRERARFLIDAGRLVEARADLVEAIGILRLAERYDRAELGRAELLLGQALGRLGRPAEGLEHGREGLRILESADSAKPREVERGREIVTALGTGGTPD